LLLILGLFAAGWVIAQEGLLLRDDLKTRTEISGALSARARLSRAIQLSVFIALATLAIVVVAT
jgi:hypothetical protein